MSDVTNSKAKDRAIQALPPLPAVALRVLQVAQNPRSSASDLAMVISSDPGLSARILRIVNSVAYRRSREVTSVQEGLVVLGFIQARNIAISSAITSAYAPGAVDARFRIQAFWRHAIAVAFKASELASTMRRIDGPSAFTTGIVHDMGRLAMFHANPGAMNRAVERVITEGITLEHAESETLDCDHALVGGELAERWKLPKDVVDAIARHHLVSENEDSLAGVIAQADRYCTNHGILPCYAIDEDPAAEDATPEPAFIRLMVQVDALMEMVTGRSPAGGMKAA